MTEHLIYNWDKATTWLFVDHVCVAPLFDAGPRSRSISAPDGLTRSLHLGQGAGDPRFVRISNIPGEVTIEQFAVFLGITPGAARDKVSGRRGRMAWVKRRGNTLFVAIPDALNYIRTETGEAA